MVHIEHMICCQSINMPAKTAARRAATGEARIELGIQHGNPPSRHGCYTGTVITARPARSPTYFRVFNDYIYVRKRSDRTAMGVRQAEKYTSYPRVCTFDRCLVTSSSASTCSARSRGSSGSLSAACYYELKCYQYIGRFVLKRHALPLLHAKTATALPFERAHRVVMAAIVMWSFQL